MAKHSTDEKKKTKTSAPEFNYFFLKEKPVQPAIIEDWGRRLVEWAKHDKDATKLSKFANKYDVSRKTMLNWVDRNEFFAACYEHAKGLIGDRREELVHANKMDRMWAEKTQRLYDPEWQTVLEDDRRHQIALRQIKSEDESKTITVIMDAVPSSPLVPAKKVIDE